MRQPQLIPELAAARPHFSFIKRDHLYSTFPYALKKRSIKYNNGKSLFAKPFLSTVTTRRLFSSDAAKVMQASLGSNRLRNVIIGDCIHFQPKQEWKKRYRGIKYYFR
jgi:hypothetical protein